MLQEMPDAERQKFLTAAQTLGDGPTGSAEASKL